ncbi:uncharacterized protein DS421_3g85850 [Arachis hypogaea]|nr:uncharacterized protein DS421_3g85850 [Arachis hypogaea]
MMAPTVAYEGATHDKQFLAQTISATTLIVTRILTDDEKKTRTGLKLTKGLQWWQNGDGAQLLEWQEKRLTAAVTSRDEGDDGRLAADATPLPLSSWFSLGVALFLSMAMHTCDSMDGDGASAAQPPTRDSGGDGWTELPFLAQLSLSQRHPPLARTLLSVELTR